MTKLVRCGINFYADVDHQKAVNDRDSLQNTKLMEHYTHLLGQLQYEGAGIWSRFNIMFGINVSLFGLETVLFTSSSTAVTEVRKPRPSSTAQQTTLKSSAKEKEN